jgi:putative restriction endonuclease
MRAFIAVTDGDWYDFLRRQPGIDEVNFWQPGGTRLFRTLKSGEPLLFKLHYPANAIVGGGFFAHASILPVSLAWDAFGVKNGAGSLGEMRTRIAKYRRTPDNPGEDYAIGCILLQAPFFLAPDDWLHAPASFQKNIVQGKGYDMLVGEGRALWDQLQPFVHAEEEPVFGDPVLVKRRLAQGTFRILVTDTYERRCAVTREKILPVLEAAHIRPVAREGDNRITNGVLLRSDVHTLFDKGYVSITPEYRFRASRRLKTDFNNGEFYHRLDGSEIWVPGSEMRRPARELLEWHNDEVFLR